LALALVLWLVWVGAERFLPLARELEASLRKALGPVERGEAIGLAVLSGFAEEFFFRGAMQTAWGWPIACLLFALLHTGRDRSFWLWTLFAGLSGLAFAGLTLWSGNLLAAVVAHCLFNAVNLWQMAPDEDAAKSLGA
jgi:membrane protease YdiL (CAAX protease family)